MRALEFAGQRDGPIRRQVGKLPLDELGQVLDDVQVGLDHLGDLGPPDLQGHGPAVAQDRAVDLRDRGGGHRGRLELGEDVRGRPAVLLAQDRLDLVESERADIIPQRRPARWCRTPAAGPAGC